jgi:hypothetical protein
MEEYWRAGWVWGVNACLIEKTLHTLLSFLTEMKMINVDSTQFTKFAMA